MNLFQISGKDYLLFQHSTIIPPPFDIPPNPFTPSAFPWNMNQEQISRAERDLGLQDKTTISTESPGVSNHENQDYDGTAEAAKQAGGQESSTTLPVASNAENLTEGKVNSTASPGVSNATNLTGGESATSPSGVTNATNQTGGQETSTVSPVASNATNQTGGQEGSEKTQLMTIDDMVKGQ